MIVAAKNSHDLQLPLSQRRSRVLSESEGLRTRRVNSVSLSLIVGMLQEELMFQSKSKDRERPTSQLKAVRQEEFPLF